MSIKSQKMKTKKIKPSSDVDAEFKHAFKFSGVKD